MRNILFKMLRVYHQWKQSKEMSEFDKTDAGFDSPEFFFDKKCQQAGTELGQAQLKLGLGITSTIDSK